METYEQDIIIEKIVAYLDCRLTDNEVLSLHAWMQQSEQHHAYFAQIKNIYEMSGCQLKASEISTETALSEILHKIAPKRKKVRYRLWIQRVAAIFFIPLFATSIIFLTQRGKTIIEPDPVVNYIEMKAATGSQCSFTLPDNTII